MASDERGTLYTGVTARLQERIGDHKSGALPGFTKRYDVKRLVWFEQFAAIEDAIRREKQIKKWRREWKVNLIERDNPHWLDLAAPWFRNSSGLGISIEPDPNPRRHSREGGNPPVNVNESPILPHAGFPPSRE